MNKRLKTIYGEIVFSWKKTIWLYLMLLSILFIDFSQLNWIDIHLNTALLFVTVGLNNKVFHSLE